jgi:hypothetical protein
MDKEIDEYKIARAKIENQKESTKQIVDAIKSIKIPEYPEIPKINMEETNQAIRELAEKLNEPLCVKLILE